MKKSLSLLIFSLAIAATIIRAQSPVAAPDQIIVIRAGTLIDGSNTQPRKNQLIFVRANRIEKIAEASGQIPAGAAVIDLSSATVLPGMIDSHTHIFLWGEDPAKGGYDANILNAGIALRAARATFACRRALEQGFTTIRDLETEGAGYGDIEIKQAIEEGTIPGPRIFGATRAISTTGGYNLEGYAPVEELKAIVDEAHGWQKKVACHAYNGIGLQRALDGGCDSIEHGLEITDAQIAQMTKQGTWYCPTITPYYGDWAPADSPNRVWHGHWRHALDRLDGAGIQTHGRIGHGARRCNSVRDFASGGNVGHERRDRRGRSGSLCGHRRGERRSAEGCWRARAHALCDEGRRGVQKRVSKINHRLRLLTLLRGRLSRRRRDP